MSNQLYVGPMGPSVRPHTPPATAQFRRCYAMLLSHKTQVTTEGRLAHFLLLRAVLGARVAHMGSAELGRPRSESRLAHGRVARCIRRVSTISSCKCTCALQADRAFSLAARLAKRRLAAHSTPSARARSFQIIAQQRPIESFESGCTHSVELAWRAPRVDAHQGRLCKTARDQLS